MFRAGIIRGRSTPLLVVSVFVPPATASLSFDLAFASAISRYRALLSLGGLDCAVDVGRDLITVLVAAASDKPRTADSRSFLCLAAREVRSCNRPLLFTRIVSQYGLEGNTAAHSLGLPRGHGVAAGPFSPSFSQVAASFLRAHEALLPQIIQDAAVRRLCPAKR